MRIGAHNSADSTRRFVAAGWRSFKPALDLPPGTAYVRSPPLVACRLYGFRPPPLDRPRPVIRTVPAVKPSDLGRNPEMTSRMRCASSSMRGAVTAQARPPVPLLRGYCAADRARQTQQLRAKRLLLATPGLVPPLPDADLMPEELRAALVLFASLFNERQRRLFAGLKALKCGWGGAGRIARLLGIDPLTVAAGRRQPVERDVRLNPARRGGGGRRPTKRAGSHRLHQSLDGPLDGRRPGQRPEVDTSYDRPGPPMNRARSVSTSAPNGRTTTQGAGLFAECQPQEAPRRPTSEPRRPVPAHHRTARALRRRQRPGISVDTRRKELVGTFHNPGAKWDRSPERVNDHDFRSDRGPRHPLLRHL